MKRATAPMIVLDDATADALMHLASLERRVELAYRVASEDATDPPARALLRSLAQQYAIFAGELRALAIEMVGPPSSSGVRAPIGWHELLDALPERTLERALEICHVRETEIVGGYRAAKALDWPESVAAALANNLAVHAAARFEIEPQVASLRLRH
jgi:hypothetical protein